MRGNNTWNTYDIDKIKITNKYNEYNNIHDLNTIQREHYIFYTKRRIPNIFTTIKSFIYLIQWIRKIHHSIRYIFQFNTIEYIHKR